MLVKGDDPRIDIDFLPQFAQCRALQCLAGLNEAAGQRKNALEGWSGAPGKENPACPENGDADAKRGTIGISPGKVRTAQGLCAESLGWGHG